jgi:hypothetical protein
LQNLRIKDENAKLVIDDRNNYGIDKQKFSPLFGSFANPNLKCSQLVNMYCVDDIESVNDDSELSHSENSSKIIFNNSSTEMKLLSYKNKKLRRRRKKLKDRKKTAKLERNINVVEDAELQVKKSESRFNAVMASVDWKDDIEFDEEIIDNEKNEIVNNSNLIENDLQTSENHNNYNSIMASVDWEDDFEFDDDTDEDDTCNENYEAGKEKPFLKVSYNLLLFL